MDVEVVPWDQLGRPRAEAVRPLDEHNWEDKAAEASFHRRRGKATRGVYQRHGDFIEHGLSERCPGCRAMKLWLA